MVHNCWRFFRWQGVGLALVMVMWVSPAVAFQFSLGELQGSLDSTLSYGLSWRMSDRDQNLIGLQEGGRAYSHNYDDGNLNYDKGELISNTPKLTSELALDYRNFGLFLRGTAFYDFESQDGDRERTELRDEALDLIGKDAELLDAYLWWSFDMGEMPGQLRLGDQVLSWGESTFIQNGINVINPFDVGKLRVPGAELKEGLVPVGMLSASLSPTENLTFEAFYQYEWEKVEIDPPGSYWSTNDFAGPGGDKVMLGFGDVHDMGNAPAEGTFLGVPRAADIYADDDGQYGIAMRLYAPALNDTEFGFYFMNYHSRLPVISSWTGSSKGLQDAANQANVAGAIAGTYIAGQGSASLTALVGAGMAQGATVNQAGAMAQTVLLLEQQLGYANTAAALQLQATDVGDPLYGAYLGYQKAVTAAATDAFAKTARYQIEYPEDIKLFGASFNTVLPGSGIALQGEVSHRQDVPLQVDDLELLLATLEPLGIAKVWGSGTLGNCSVNPAFCNSAFGEIPNYSQYSGGVSPLDIALNGGQPVYLQGYQRLDVTQVQTTATKLFGPSFGADQFTVVGEVGLTYVHDMPSKDTLRFDGPGTPVSGNPAHSLSTDPRESGYNPFAAHADKPSEPAGAFADATSWGYRLVAKLDFNDAIGAVTLSPRIAWAHDVDGTSPGPGGNFVEHRKAVTLGLGASYQSSWSADLSYTDFFGAGRYNLVNDRDFLAFNVKYSF